MGFKFYFFWAASDIERRFGRLFDSFLHMTGVSKALPADLAPFTITAYIPLVLLIPSSFEAALQIISLLQNKQKHAKKKIDVA